MSILTTIKNIFRPERETLWLLFSFDSDPDIVSMYFKTVGNHNTVDGNRDHYDIVMDAPDEFRGFLHTHPRGWGLTPSYYDVATVSAWEKALGRPLLNIIAMPDLSDYFALYGGVIFDRRINIHHTGSFLRIGDKL